MKQSLFALAVLFIGCSSPTPTPTPIPTSTPTPRPTATVAPTYVPYSTAPLLGTPKPTITPDQKALLEMFNVDEVEKQVEFCLNVEYPFGLEIKREVYKSLVNLEDMVWLHMEGSDEELSQIEQYMKKELAILMKISVPMLDCISLEGSAFGWPMYDR